MKYLTLIFLCSPLLAATSPAPKPSAPKKVERAPVATLAAEPVAKVVAYGAKDVVRIQTQIRFTTLIVLPPSERILDFTCGDKEFWVINGAENIAHVKPARVGAQTNMNLVTASGNIYSFVLVEGSDEKLTPDLKVFIEPKEESMVAASQITPRFVAASQLDDYRQQVEIAKEETRRVKAATQAAIDSGISKFLANVRFPYLFEAGRKPFYVRAMYHDGQFMYIHARPEETPVLYEWKDGKPNLVNFQYKNGVYVIDKILDKGYLVIGKAKLGFEKQE